MKTYLFLCFMLLNVSLLFSQYPSNLHNQDLRVWIKQNLYDGEHTDLGYSSARQQMYSYCDEVGGKIHCIYTDFEMDAEFTTFPDPINAEHLVPQSLYGSVSPMRSDIHNLRPSHQSPNSARSNLDYGEVPDNQATWYGINGSGSYYSTGNEPSSSDDFSERSNTLWEPQEDRKGDIARQVFYFYTMYPTQAGPLSDLVDLNTLYQWHLDDPVDANEQTRNDRVEEVQGNRNPYVDYSDLAFDAWLWVEISGCTNELACNYNLNANTDDGSCTFPGCLDPAANNYDPSAGCSDGNCTYNVLGCMDPLACNFLITANVDDGSCTFPACIDPLASNYNPNAGCDDGSCTYDISGCTDINACNYVPEANIEDGSCTYPGCNDPVALNYSSAAGCDDGSCFYIIIGCTDILACNFNSEANLDDFTCVYPGCDDPNALNFDPSAGCNDGSCQYICEGDANNDLIVNILDIIEVSGQFGCSGDCSADVNNDGNVGILDFVVISSNFGNDCN